MHCDVTDEEGTDADESCVVIECNRTEHKCCSREAGVVPVMTAAKVVMLR